jgi:hypothetical protein
MLYQQEAQHMLRQARNKATEADAKDMEVEPSTTLLEQTNGYTQATTKQKQNHRSYTNPTYKPLMLSGNHMQDQSS